MNIPGQQDILDLIGLLRPRALVGTAMSRLGSRNDGGYVVPEAALDCDVVLSISDGSDAGFDRALAARGATVLRFDARAGEEPAGHPRITVERAAWGAASASGILDFAAIHDRMKALGGKRALLEFDVGGAEYDALDVADARLLADYDVVVCELHAFDRLGDAAFFAKVARVLGKLHAHHVPVHLHANNRDGVVMVGGVPIPKSLEVTWLRRDLGTFAGPSREPIPGALDRPNDPTIPDLCLNPFGAGQPPRSIWIYCDGGFGNRFNAMLSGLAIAEASGLAPVIVWPTNNWCGASFDELFERPRNVVDRELATFVAEKDRFMHLMVEDHLKMNVPNASPYDFPTLSALVEHIRTGTRDVFYYVPLVPPCIDLDSLRKHVAGNPFRADLRKRSASFVAALGGREFFGVQIRKTDFGPAGADDTSLYDLVARTGDHLFFVCSDDRGVEERFAALPNVRINPKVAHVEKLKDGDWNDLAADHSGRVYACNVNRSAQSVVDALVDLLILSNSRIVRTSGSTFLNAALMLQACAPA